MEEEMCSRSLDQGANCGLHSTVDTLVLPGVEIVERSASAAEHPAPSHGYEARLARSDRAHPSLAESAATPEAEATGLRVQVQTDRTDAAGDGGARRQPQPPTGASPKRHSPWSASPWNTIGCDATEAIDGAHLRAARALLDWAMSDLARTSGLSLSTIRRLEQCAPAVSPRNRRAAIEALEAGGVRFLRLEDGTVAVAELRRSELGRMVASARA